MQENRLHGMSAVIAAWVFTAMACGLSVDFGSTATPQQPPLQPPTMPRVPASSPTSPPEPTVQNTSAPSPSPESPDVTATDANGQVAADVEDYYRKGFLPFENGQLRVLDDFSKKGSSLEIFDFTPTRQDVQDFALWADIELNTTGPPVTRTIPGAALPTEYRTITKATRLS